MGAIRLALISTDDLDRMLACPICGSRLARDGAGWRCAAVPGGVAHSFVTVHGQPVLVDFEHSVLDRVTILNSGGTSLVPRRREARRWVKPILEALGSGSSAPVAGRVLAALRARVSRPTILVVGGATVAGDSRVLYDDPDIRLVSFDIYASPQTQFVADAHAIPLLDSKVDAVWVQAVLEHVLDPAGVVAEIHRVLRPDGVVFSEIPFMQQVHEGAYDFTRFTDLGQRWLFRGFDEIESGVIAGPGVALAWALDHWVRGVTRSRSAGRLVAIACSWMGWLERAIPERFARDSASCLYFVGRRSERAITPRELIARYRGAQGH